MKSPELLKQGDTVMVIAPSGLVNRSRCEDGIVVLEEWGLKVLRGNHLYDTHGIFAGSDNSRLTDLQGALDNQGIKAIFCARGGYGLSRIIDRVDFSKFIKSPSWIIGYSDITVMHLWLNSRYGVQTIHGEMVTGLASKGKSTETISTLRETLFNGPVDYNWNSVNFTEGKARGLVTGGNLSMLCSLTGTGIGSWLAGKILFIEDTGEHLYRLDRMMAELRLSGILNNISGIIFGGLTDMTDSDTPFGMSCAELVMDAVAGYDYPVAMDFPAGHQSDNRAFTSGREAIFTVSGGSAELKWV